MILNGQIVENWPITSNYLKSDIIRHFNSEKEPAGLVLLPDSRLSNFNKNVFFYCAHGYSDYGSSLYHLNKKGKIINYL